jgi:hypothetical protein
MYADNILALKCDKYNTVTVSKKMCYSGSVFKTFMYMKTIKIN